MSFVCSAIYYWYFLKKFVFKRSLAGVVLSSIGMVIISKLVDKFIGNWLIIHSSFISARLQKEAIQSLLQTRIVFNFNYPIARVILPLTGLAYLVRSLTQETQMEALKQQQLLSELNYLKAQIHPHFFFNTLNNIYSLALKQSAQTAPMVAKLGEMMRYILYEADQKTVLLSREVSFIMNYIEVEKIRHQQNKQIQLDVQGIEPHSKIEPLLLLPFVENAFKHGLEQETAGGYVQVVICQTAQELILNIKNSKPGSSAHQEKGIGLQNVSKRLNILYPAKYQLNVNDREHCYEVTLTLQTL